MALSERKTKVLLAVIKTYLETGEPVGSRTISKLEDVGASSATIRNEMADLEELGYIFSPHTSAGRIPSDKGYRFYVDKLFEEKEEEVNKMKDIVLEKADRMDALLKQAANALAMSTNYASVISAPKSEQNKIKFIQLSPVEENQLLVVIVSQGNIIRNKVINIEKTLNTEEILKLNMLLNTYLNGCRLEEISLGIIAKLKEQAGDNGDIIENVLSELVKAIKVEDMEVYTSGATNILKYPELRDKETATDLIKAFEEKQELGHLVKTAGSGDNEIKVYIGDENSSENMKDCSLITTTYELGDGLTGTIGIVGPKRMDYKKVMNTLNDLRSELDNIYKK